MAAFSAEGLPGPGAEVWGEGLAWPSSEPTTQAQGHLGRQACGVTPATCHPRFFTQAARGTVDRSRPHPHGHFHDDHPQQELLSSAQRERHPLCPERSGRWGWAVR